MYRILYDRICLYFTIYVVKKYLKMQKTNQNKLDYIQFTYSLTRLFRGQDGYLTLLFVLLIPKLLRCKLF